MDATEPTLDILAIADLHHTRSGDVAPATDDARRTFRDGPLLVRKGLLRLKHEGVEPGLIILLGDLLDDGRDPGAEAGLQALADTLRQTGLPFLVVPGNHDGPPERVARVFGCAPGLHVVGGYGFLVFHDRYQPDDRMARSPADLASPPDAAARRPGLPLVSVQHNPLHPRIEDTYPYLPENADAILASLQQAGCVLSLSGHYHDGQAAHDVGGVVCYTAPAACEAPFRLAHIRLQGRSVTVHEHALRLTPSGLTDVHCHTEMAYCRSDVASDANIAIAGALGLGRLCLTEHAFQLYLLPDAAWSWRWQTDEGMVWDVFHGGCVRMDEYCRLVRNKRGAFVRIGLEVDLLHDGRLFLRDEDQTGWDLLVGSVHAIDGAPRGLRQADAERLFMRDTSRLIDGPIRVLAHPFRYFRRGGYRMPLHLYPEVAALLAERGVAAEINFHANGYEPGFVEECLSRGVRLALGSDAHDLAEVAELAPHLRVLREAGVRDEELSHVLLTMP